MKKIYFLSCIFLISFYVNAQIDVDPLTGRLQANIPLTQVTKGELNVPISLVYQGGGIKVEQTEGTAGMGWELNAGGAVVRDRRGLPDDFSETSGDQRKGWLSSGIASAIQNFIPQANDNLSNCADEKADNIFLNSWSYFKDSEPDVFTFFAPGLNGSFVFDQDGNPQKMPYQDITITKSPATGPITSFTIRNNLGITYVFSAMETMKRQTIGSAPNYFHTDYYQFRNELSFTMTWRLTSIASANGDNIMFTYTTNDEEHSQNEISIVSTTGVETILYTIQEDIKTKQLSTITTSLQTVAFDWVDNRISGITESRQFTSRIKSFSFEYGNALDSEPLPLIIYRSRAFLTKVTELHDCVPGQSHRFNYDGLFTDDGGRTYRITLGFARRKFQDLWGYCNGTSQTKVPDIYVKPSETNGERFRTQPVASESPTYAGASRFPNEGFASRGSLSQITYPHGGMYNISYECNQYYDNGASSSKKGGGVRVSQISTFGAARGSSEIVTKYEYLMADGKSSGKLSYPPSYAFYNGTEVLRTTRHMGPDSYVLYERAAIKQTGKGKTVYTYQLPGMYPSTVDAGWSATAHRVARYVPASAPGEPAGGCESIGNLMNGSYSYPWAANQNFDYVRGLPQYVTEYTESGAKVSEKEYSYQAITGANVATTLKGLRYELTYAGDIYVYGSYSLSINTTRAILTEKIRVADELSPGPDPANPTNFLETTKQYSYNSTHKLLEQVDVTNSDNVVNSTRYKYAYDYNVQTPDAADVPANAIKSLRDAWRHGTLLQTTNSVSGAVTNASLVLYKNFDGKILPYKTLSYPRKSGYVEPSLITNGSGKQEFSFNSDLIGTEFIAYAGINPTGAKDYRNKKSGSHYGFSNTIPVAVFTNALPAEVVYEGFETTTGYGLTSGATTSNSYSGNTAGDFSVNGYRANNNVQKGSSMYKASAWVYPTVPATISFKAANGTTSVIDQKSISLTSADVNTWKYVEAILDVSAAPASFYFQILNTGAVYIDDVLFHPAESEVKVMTYDFMFGKTSELNERGDAAFTAYDDLGRPKHILNKNKDLVQFNEYRKNDEPIVPANSGFTADLTEDAIRVGTPVTFTNSNNCSGVPVSSRQWKIGETIVGTGSTYTYTPLSIGPVTLTLGVTLSNGSYSSSSKFFCVTAEELDVSISVQSTDDPTHTWLKEDETSECFFTKVFTAIRNNSGCGGTASYLWEYKLSNEDTWHLITDGDGQDHILNLNQKLSNSYSMRCTVSQACSTVSPCKPYNNITSSSQFVKWVNITQCP